MNQLEAEIVKAITDQGPMPHYHRSVVERHRREWPTLWRALDKLVEHYS